MANDLAVYLTQHASDTPFERTGKLPVSNVGDTYADANREAFLQEYKSSVPMPKMIETSNFWVELEIAFAQIWDGADANDRLRQLSEKIMTQVTGEPYTETVIEEEEEAVEEIEYLDEEELRREAQEGGEETQ